MRSLLESESKQHEEIRHGNMSSKVLILIILIKNFLKNQIYLDFLFECFLVHEEVQSFANIGQCKDNDSGMKKSQDLLFYLR